jgi:hypothetical protein
VTSVRLTVRHAFDFGADRGLVGNDLVRPEAWDALRLQTSGPFGLPADRLVWEAQADAAAHLAQRAIALLQWIRSAGASSVASYGVGTAMLELHLHRLDRDMRLSLTDYAPETVRRLGSLFQDVEIVHHDLLRDGPLDVDLHVLHRVDSELSDRQWRELLGRFRASRMLVIATEVASVRRVLLELAFRASRRRASRAGWLRTRAAFEALWPPTHSAQLTRIADLWAWDLTPR